MHSAEDTQVSSQGRASAFAAVAGDFADAAPLIVTRPPALFTPGLAMPDRRVPKPDLCLDSGLAWPFIGVQNSRRGFDDGAHHLEAGLAISVVPHEVPHLPAGATFGREDRWAIRLIRAVPAPLVSAPARGGGRIAMRLAFFPRLSGTVHQLPAPCRARCLEGGRRVSFVVSAGAIREERVVAVTSFAPPRGTGPVLLGEASPTGPAVGAAYSSRVEMLLEPARAGPFIRQVVDLKVDHGWGLYRLAA